MNKDVKLSTFGNELMMLYGRVNLLQGEFAASVGISPSALRKWESDTSSPKAESLKRVIEILLSKGAFSKGAEQTEAMHLWELANKKGLKVPFDEVWFRGVMQAQARAETGDTSEFLQPTDQGNEENLTWPSITEEMDGSSRTTPNMGSHRSAVVGIVPSADPDKTRGRSKGPLRILIALVILTIIGSAGALFFYTRDHAITQANKAAREQASETAIAQYPGYLSGKGTLAFFDPLNREGGSKWTSYGTNSTDGLCQFTEGAYHAVESPQSPIHYVIWCGAKGGPFSNFAFEVQLTIIQGDCGGMIFRDDGQGHLYYFRICQDGTYSVIKYMSSNGSDIKILQDSNSSAIKTGLGQQNKIAIVANGSTMTFYVNEQQIDQEQDSSYTPGYIALIAAPFHHLTDVAYSNARLWTL